jgi:hypothetical protein
MKRLALLMAVVAGCAHEGIELAPTAAPKSQPGMELVAPAPTPAPTPAPPKVSTRIELTAVTLADDCGGAPPWSAPVKTAQLEVAPSKAKAKGDSAAPMGARAKRRCEQTSMQLAIIAGDASTIQVKSVELFDETGKSLGTLSASKPTRWSDASGRYEAWDELVAAGSTSSVSYVLAQPKWDQIGNRWNRTYTLKTVLSVGGVNQSAQKDVTLSAPTSLPPNVKT